MYCELDAGNFSGVNVLMDWNAFASPSDGMKFDWNVRYLLNQAKQNLLEKFVVVHVEGNNYEQLVFIL